MYPYSEKPLHPAAGSTWFPACSWTKATVPLCGATLEHVHMMTNGFLERMRAKARFPEGEGRKLGDGNQALVS